MSKCVVMCSRSGWGAGAGRRAEEERHKDRRRHAGEKMKTRAASSTDIQTSLRSLERGREEEEEEESGIRGGVIRKAVRALLGNCT